MEAAPSGTASFFVICYKMIANDKKMPYFVHNILESVANLR
ncbi:MAG: hypothetical protein BWY72_00146 [Bacteroidetes bacterium ADurb.Bin416]|nr:MAG: hypothetical protein BWY72_00146 [Bacteroidetes bacterium ADurb.Bin416]